MLRLRRSEGRLHQRHHTEERWATFEPGAGPGGLGAELAALEAFREGNLPPRAVIPRRDGPGEIITYVHEGTLTYADSHGRVGLIQAGQFQVMTAGPEVRHHETNASPTRWAHVYQLCLEPAAGGESGYEVRRFSAAQRRGRLCVVASPDGRRGSLRLRRDVLLYSALLEPGQHVIRELPEGRNAWLHVVAGALAVGGLPVTAGDGVAIVDELAVSATCFAPAEILLLELDARSEGRSI